MGGKQVGGARTLFSSYPRQLFIRYKHGHAPCGPSFHNYWRLLFIVTTFSANGSKNGIDHLDFARLGLWLSEIGASECKHRLYFAITRGVASRAHFLRGAVSRLTKCRPAARSVSLSIVLCPAFVRIKKVGPREDHTVC